MTAENSKAARSLHQIAQTVTNFFFFFFFFFFVAGNDSTHVSPSGLRPTQ